MSITNPYLDHSIADLITRTKGLDEIYDAVVAGGGTTPAAVWAYATRTLTDPDSYKADVSALALEATLTAIKGSGWTNETLKAIKDAIDALNDLAQSDILSDATPFAGADIALIKGYVDEVESLLKNATYGLSALDIDLGTLLTRLSATRAGYLDNLSGGAVALASVCTEVRLAHLDADITSRSSHTAADIWSVATRTLTSHAFPFTNPASALDVTNIQTASYTRLGAPVGASISADIAAIKAEIDNATYGLSAIETLVDEVESLLKNATYGLSALDTDLGTLLTRLSATRAGYLDNLSAGAVALASVCTETRLAELDAANLPTDVDAILTDTADIQPRVPRIVCHMDFWSDNDDEIALTTSAGADHNLPNIVVAGLPTGITIIRVVALLKIAIIKDTSGSDNAVNGATALKVDAASDYSSTVTAIDIPDNSWAVDVSEATERGGDVMIGDNDVKTEVTGNATFYARLEDIVCDGNNLKLKDIAWGLRIYFTI